MVLAILVSETTSNTASAAVVVPIIIPIAMAAGINPFVPALAATFAASFGFMLPVSTPQNAIVYGSGVVPITKMIRTGISFDILGAILIILLLPVMVGVARASAADAWRLTSRIAVIPGDGIGPEVVAATRTVLDAVGEMHGLDLAYDEFDWSCRRYAETGAMMPDDGLDRLAGHDAILLGAVGWPGVPDHVSLWGLLIPIRRHFRQYVNQRPIAVFEGVESPLRGARPGEVDLVVVRENVEGEYSEIGGRLNRGFPDEMAVQESVFTRAGVSRIADYAFELARQPQRLPDLGDQEQRHRAHDAVLGRGGRRAGGGVPGRALGPGAASTRWPRRSSSSPSAST